jgi:glycosyltransferase involved in cell wall biosynthesis
LGGKLRSLCYIANPAIPSKSADSIQVIVVPLRLRAWLEAALSRIDTWEYYSIPPNFKLTHLLYPPTLKYRPVSYGLVASLYAKYRGFDLVYTRNLFSTYWLPLLNIHTIFATHEYSFHRHPRFRSFFMRGIRKGLLKGIVANSWGTARLYQTAGIPEANILVAHNGVNLTLFEPRLAQAEARERLNLPLGTKIACYCGHLYEARGIEELLDCASALKDVLFVFVGGYAHDVERRRREAEKMSLHNVIFRGHVPRREVPPYLYAADVLVMPYPTGVTTVDFMSPMKMFDYMAASRPIVATDLPTIREVLGDGHNAILVRPDNSEALTRGIKIALENVSLAKKISEQAHKDVQNNAWDKRAERVLRFIEDRLR